MNRIEELLLKLLRHWLPYYLLAWLAAAGTSALAVHYAWHCFDSTRQDGNGGHATIDFGGQYLMGKMLVTGHGQELYNRRVQREVLAEVYPPEDWVRSDRKPDDPPDRGDVENMMYWVMGNDDPAQPEAAATFLLPLGAADPLSESFLLAACDKKVWRKDPADKAAQSVLPLGATDPLSASLLVSVCQADVWTQDRVAKAEERRVGGPLYPPVNAFVAAPLALMPAPIAYRVQQLFNVFLVFLAAAGARTLARGRVWWPVLVPAIMMFPGFAGSINLGQNATLTLTIVVWGWALAARGRPVLGGMVWGLLAFKPVWALAFFLVPFLSRRWRMCLAMVAAGAALGLLTLPFVGLHSWLDWLSIGKEAATTYDVEKNWIFLSRDLLSVPRRWWIDFEKGYYERLGGTFFLLGHWPISVGLACFLFGWGMILFALENTVRLAVLRRGQAAAAPDGPPAAFLFLGAWMCCYHFMYYDALLGAMGLFLLFTEPRRFLSPLLVVLAPLRSRAGRPGRRRLPPARPARGAAAAGAARPGPARRLDAQPHGADGGPAAAANPLCLPDPALGGPLGHALGHLHPGGRLGVVRLAVAAPRREGRPQNGPTPNRPSRAFDVAPAGAGGTQRRARPRRGGQSPRPYPPTPRSSSSLAPMSRPRIERFADEDGADAGPLQAKHVGAAADAALADQAAIGRQPRGQVQRVLQPRDEGAQVAVVDADRRAPASRTRGRLSASYSSTRHCMPRSCACAEQARQRLVCRESPR